MKKFLFFMAAVFLLSAANSQEVTTYFIQFGPQASQSVGGSVFLSDAPDIEFFVEVEPGTEAVTFSVVPIEGHLISAVFVDGANNPGAVATGSYTFYNVRANHTIFATFIPVTFTITSTASAFGTINPNGSVLVDYGSEKVFQAIPNDGAVLTAVFVDGVNIGIPSNGIYTFQNVKTNHTISAQFEQIYYQITTTAGLHGNIHPQNPSVAHGASQIVSFLPHNGYKVTQVKIDGVVNPTAALAGNYTFFNVVAPHTVETTFEKLTYTITSSASYDGTITPEGTITVDYNDHSPIYVFDPAEGYIVKQVFVDGVNNTQAVAQREYRFLNVKANHTVHVVFCPDHFTIAATATQGGAITPDGIVNVPAGINKTFYFLPNTGYQVKRVLIDGINNEQAVANGAFTFTEVYDTHEIIVQFEKKKYEVTWENVTGVTVLPQGNPIVEYGDNFVFKLKIENDYSQSHPIVRVNEVPLYPYGGKYTINFIERDQFITISNVFPNTISENEATINVFSHSNIVSIKNDALVPLKKVEIMDMYGRVVWQGEAPGTQTDISLNAAAGLYSVRIFTNDHPLIVKKVSIH